MARRALVLLAVAAAMLVGAATTSAALSSGPTLRVDSSRFGRVLFDGRGFVLYAFTRDRVGGRSTCYGNCADAWPPYIAVGKRLSVERGLKKSLLGTAKRRDGKLQITY